MRYNFLTNPLVLLIPFLALILVGAGCQQRQTVQPASSVPQEQDQMREERSEGMGEGESSEMTEGESMGSDDSSGEGSNLMGSEEEGTTEEVKELVLIAKNFEYSIKEIRVKKGDRVKIILENEQGFHDWVIDEFNARTPQISAPNSATVEFFADKIGTFEYYCAVGSHRQLGMKGNLIVE